MRVIGDFFQLNCHPAFTRCDSIVTSTRNVLRSLVEEHLGGVLNRRLLVWSLSNVEEFLGQVKT